MASPITAAAPQTIVSTTGIPKIDVTGDSAAVAAILNNTPFDDSADVAIGKVSASISGGQTLQLPSGPSDTVAFSGSASALSAVASYISPANLANDLGFSDAGNPLAIDFGKDPNSRWMALRWGYSLAGGASGKVALGSYGAATFGVDGSSEGLYALVRRVPKQTLARDACVDLVSNWKLPKSVNALLPQGTWIITELEGQLNASLGVTAGYDFNWVRHEQLGGLSGDIGLRLLLGINATLGAVLAGKFVLVLSCDDAANVVRYRLFRTSKKGWNFALNAGAEVDPTTGKFLPETLNDFIKAIFGVHDAQLVKFLTTASAQDIIDGLGSDFLSAFGVDGFQTLTNLLNEWNNLPHDIASVIWKYAGQSSVLSTIADVAKQISDSTPATLTGLLDKYLQDVNFSKTPVGEWLTATADKSLFELYESLAAKSDLTIRARTLLQILDGDALQSALMKLKSKVDNVLDLGTLQQAAQNGSVTGLAEWVQDRLSTFLGIPKGTLASKISDIDRVITLIRSKGDQFYQATVKALNNQYKFSLDYAYSSSSVNTALVDIEFSAAALPQLQDAIAGNFSQLFSTPLPGVTIKTATLTHALQRHSHLELHVPFASASSDHVLQAFASEKVVDAADGRLQLFEAGAKDEDIDWGHVNTRRYAQCSFGISGTAAKNGVRQYQLSSVDFGYTLKMLRASMTRNEFTYQFQPVANAYFPSAFGQDVTASSFEEWVVDWDKFTDQAPGSLGDGTIGDTWSSVQLGMPSSANQDWVSSMLDPNAPEPDYKAMSRAMQAKYRAVLLNSYGTNPSNFANISGPMIDAFFVYVALAVINDFSLNDDGDMAPAPKSSAIIWDVADRTKAAAIISSQVSLNSLQQIFTNIGRMLTGIPQLRKYAQFYSANEAVKLAGKVMADNQRLGNVCWLLEQEADILEGARSAFSAMRQAGNRQIGNALDILTVSTMKLVETFNSKLSSVFDTSNVIRYFGPLLLQTAVEGMYPGKAPKVVNALLDVAVLKTGILKNGGLSNPQTDPVDSQILLRQRISNLD
jgi:hypothetical protein